MHAICNRGRCKCIAGYTGTGYECIKKGNTRSKYRPNLNEEVYTEGVLLLALKVLWRAIIVYTCLIKKEFDAFM